MAAAVHHLSGSRPAVWHNDHSRPESPRIRRLEEEIARVVRARVVNPKWIRGVMRHGYKGAFEMAATVDYLFAFAATARAVGDHHFDAVFEAYVEDREVRAFFDDNNPPPCAKSPNASPRRSSAASGARAPTPPTSSSRTSPANDPVFPNQVSRSRARSASSRSRIRAKSPETCSTNSASGVSVPARISSAMASSMGAGTPPPELAGRDELLESIHVAAERARRRLAARSVLLLGLRGVGKTVLLERVHDRTQADGFATVMIEATERSFLPALLAAELHRALLRLSRQQRLRDRVSRAMRTLAGFVSALKLRYGDIEVAIDGPGEPGVADSGDLELDLVALFEVLGAAADASGTALIRAGRRVAVRPEAGARGT